MADNVTIDIRGQDANLQAALDRSEMSVKGFGKTVKTVMTVDILQAGIAAAKGIINIGKAAFSWGKKMLDLFIEQEQSEARLAAVIKATGNAAGFTTQQMFDMAAAMQNVTTTGDEVWMSAQAILASFKNIRGDVFKDALMSAADLSALLGTDVNSAILQIGKALNDPVKGLTSLGRAGVQFTDQQKEMIKGLQESGDMLGAQTVILRELEGQFGGTAEAMANTFGGRLKQMQNRLGDVGEKIGEALIPMLEAIAPIVEQGMAALENLAPVVQNIGLVLGKGLEGAIKRLQPVFNWLVDKAVWAFSAIQTAVENWQDVFWLAQVQFKLAMLQVSEEAKHALTEKFPAYLKFVQDEWKKGWLGIEMDLNMVLDNMLGNIEKFQLALLKLMKGDLTGLVDIGLTLSESAEATIGTLPKVAARVIGEEEAGLIETADLLAQGFADRFGTSFEKNKAKLSELFKSGMGITLDGIIGDPSFDFGFEEPEEKAAKAGKNLEGSFEGLLALNKRISEAAAKGADPLIKLNEEQLAAQRQQALKLEAMEKQNADQLVVDRDIARSNDIIAEKLVLGFTD